MNRTQHPSNNDVLGAPQGWDQTSLTVAALPITRCLVEGRPTMVSYWKPDAEELQILMNGGTVALFVIGDSHPVVAVGAEP